MKTIEEAAISYATEVDRNVEELYGIENPPTSLTFGECAAEAFFAGANHIMSLPLSERITDEERKKIKALYLNDEELEGVKTAFGTYPISAATITKNMLEHIFGKAMFEEKGGDNDNC